ncbi:MAG: cation:proton antiporter, partial [Acetobacteraceae bacterium]
AAGRDAFAVLLLQDIAFVPLVALVPLLSSGHLPTHLPLVEVLRGLAAVAVILVGGHFLLEPAFDAIGGTKTPELFSAAALLVVLGTAAIATWAGLSASLGAFVAGVLLSDSEYRHELKADIDPYEGLLLGFFFISVGMSADIRLAGQHPFLVTIAVLGLLIVKAAIAFGIELIKRRSASAAVRFALALAPGSELTFVFFAAAAAIGAISQHVAGFATLAVALSMVATPIMFALSENLLIPRLERRQPPKAEKFPESATPVLICGFGRMGQIVGRVLNMHHVPFTALDRSPGQIAVVRRFGGKVYFGDPARPEVLRAAGVEAARMLVVTVDDEAAVLAIVDAARRNFPHLRILARARNRRAVHHLMDRGLERIVRETYFSSLKLARWALEDLGISSKEAGHTIALFTEHDERLLEETHAIYTDEKQLIQTTQQAAEELAVLLDADRERT